MPTRPPTGLGHPCMICRRPMLASSSGRGYCVPCAVPVGDVPLVPASWSVKRFLQIRSAYERGVRDHNEDVRAWRRFLIPGSRPASLRVGKERREDPAEADEGLLHLARAGKQRTASRAGGRPRMLTAADEKRLRGWAGTENFTVKLMAERLNVAPRTVRHYLKRLGLKLKKRPPRRPRRR